MTDTSTPPPTQDAAPAAPPPEAGTEDWKTKYEREVEHRRRERNLYSPVARIIDGLHDDDRTTLAELADAIRRQDRDYLVEFGLATAENVAGKPVADIIASRQQQQGMGTPGDITARSSTTSPTAADVAAANPGMTAEQVAQAVRDALAAEREAEAAEKRRAEYLDRVTRTMRENSIEPGTDDAIEVIQIARGLGGDIDRAIRVWRADRNAREVGLAAAGAMAANVPPPAPNGAPVGSAPANNLTPVERAKLRLQNRQG